MSDRRSSSYGIGLNGRDALGVVVRASIRNSAASSRTIVPDRPQPAGIESHRVNQRRSASTGDRSQRGAAEP
jgi:hypothetical protein